MGRLEQRNGETWNGEILGLRYHGTVRYWDCDGTERSRHKTTGKRGHETAVR